MNVDLNELASQARPVSEDDWGSDRQINAENIFFFCVNSLLNDDAQAELSDFCQGGTTEENIDKALQLIATPSAQKVA